MLGPFATTSHLTPIHQVSQLHCRIDVHNDDDDNDNVWQRGPLWPHGMGPTKQNESCICAKLVGFAEWTQHWSQQALYSTAVSHASDGPSQRSARVDVSAHLGPVQNSIQQRRHCTVLQPAAVERWWPCSGYAGRSQRKRHFTSRKLPTFAVLIDRMLIAACVFSSALHA